MCDMDYDLYITRVEKIFDVHGENSCPSPVEPDEITRVAVLCKNSKLVRWSLPELKEWNCLFVVDHDEYR
jgi:hypothetical protein